MTKSIFAVSVLVLHAMHVAAYIDDSMMRKFATSSLPTTWTKGFQTQIQPKAASRPKTRVVPVSPKKKESAATPGAFNVDEIIRAEYESWCFRYGKKGDRFEIFRSNFMKQMDFNRKTGQFLLLNEFGDMTPEEYEQVVSTQPSASLDDLDDRQVNAIFEQVAKKGSDQEFMAVVDNDATNTVWNDYSFAMAFDEKDMEGELQNNHDSSSHPQNDDKDAPLHEHSSSISSLESSVEKAASPEVQTVRPTEGVFGATVRSVFSKPGSVSPMGSSVGRNTKIF